MLAIGNIEVKVFIANIKNELTYQLEKELG